MSSWHQSVAWDLFWNQEASLCLKLHLFIHCSGYVSHKANCVSLLKLEPQGLKDSRCVFVQICKLITLEGVLRHFLCKQTCFSAILLNLSVAAVRSESDWIAVLWSMDASELYSGLWGVLWRECVARFISPSVHHDTWHQYQCKWVFIISPQNDTGMLCGMLVFMVV